MDTLFGIEMTALKIRTGWPPALSDRSGIYDFHMVQPGPSPESASACVGGGSQMVVGGGFFTVMTYYLVSKRPH